MDLWTDRVNTREVSFVEGRKDIDDNICRILIWAVDLRSREVRRPTVASLARLAN